MATIINNPADRNQTSDEGVGTGLIVSILVVAFAALLFFIYGLPALRATEGNAPGTSGTQNIEVQLPATTPTVTTPNPVVTTPTPELAP